MLCACAPYHLFCCEIVLSYACLLGRAIGMNCHIYLDQIFAICLILFLRKCCETVASVVLQAVTAFMNYRNYSTNSYYKNILYWFQN